LRKRLVWGRTDVAFRLPRGVPVCHQSLQPVRLIGSVSRGAGAGRAGL